MEKDRLPHNIDPKKLANLGQVLSGIVPLDGMDRLASLTQPQHGAVQLTLQFAHDADNRCVITGDLQTELELTCQRCMGPMRKSITHHFLLTPIRSESEADNLLESYEPVLMQEDQINIANMVEDELLLQVPMIPKHEAGESCIDLSQYQEAVNDDQNPFTDLQTIRQPSKEN